MTELSQVEGQDSIETMKVQQLYCRRVLNVPAGGRAVVTNGRILGALEETEKFTMDDFSLLERYSVSSYGDKILQTLKKKTVNDEDDGIYCLKFSLLLKNKKKIACLLWLYILFYAQNHFYINSLRMGDCVQNMYTA